MDEDILLSDPPTWEEISAAGGATLINLTPHVITVLDEEGHPIKEIPPADHGPLRVTGSTELVEDEDGPIVDHEWNEIPLYREKECPVPHLGGQIPGVFLIVTREVAKAARYRQRPDLLVPNWVEDEEGKTLGCRGFYRVLSYAV